MITPSEEVYIKTPQDKTDTGSSLCKICKRIASDVYLVTVSNVTTTLVSVVNTSNYHLVYNEVSGIFLIL